MKRNKFLTMAAVAVAACGLTAGALMARADDTNTATNKPVPYPLDHCVVSGDKFGGDMGDAVVFIYCTNGINQEIKFCCDMCKPKFLKDPDKYMKIIQAAEAAQPGKVPVPTK